MVTKSKIVISQPEHTTRQPIHSFKIQENYSIHSPTANKKLLFTLLHKRPLKHGVNQLINGINCAIVKINPLLAYARRGLFLTIAQLAID